MKKLLIIALLAVSTVGMAQTDSSITTSFRKDTGGPAIYQIGLYRAQSKIDTAGCYFKEILDVKDGKLITQWVKGFVVRQTRSISYFDNADIYQDYYLYADKKTKVTNKVIQSY